LKTKQLKQFSSRNQVNGQQYSDDIPVEELQTVLRAILQPENYKYEMHRKSLENALENMLAAARESDYYEQPEEDDKRSIATLAKNGQLPSVPTSDTDMESLMDEADQNGQKRNIASMARSGLIGGKRNVQSLARQYSSGKRNIGALMRNNMLPGSGKRNIASMARNGFGKRNVGTFKNWALPKFNGKYMDGEFLKCILIEGQCEKDSIMIDLDGKRNIQSMKNQLKGRKKRETMIGGEALEPVYQNGPLDYEELLQALSEDMMMTNPSEKRFLGEFNELYLNIFN
jgi:hypothetical protein